MASRQRNRLQLWLWMLGALFLFANLIALATILNQPISAAARAPLLLTVFIVTILFSLLGIFLLLRSTLNPYRKLVGVAEQASLATGSSRAPDEAQFVLETFQTVVAQLQAQQQELQKLNAQTSARAASAEEFNERIVASVPSGLIAFNAHGTATVVNAPARAILETNGEALGQHVSALLRNAPGLAEMVMRCLATGEVYRREEVAATRTMGGIKQLGATIAPIELLPERGVLCLLTDITEITQLREQIALKKNLANLGEMSAGLAHEFKNALATLHGYAQLLQRTHASESGNAAATAMLQEVRNLADMVTAFLNFARPQTLELANVSLHEIVLDCAAELNTLFDESHITFSVEGELMEARADATLLRQAVLNLLRNAAEAIDESSTERRVTVRGAHENDAHGKEWASLKIEDTGSGIDPSDIERIFIPFFTTKSKGHGIGLALAHRVITDHGGKLIVANSAATEGAIFTISLPV